MSFFGFETNIPRPDAAANQSSAEEDIAIYTWGDVSYDTLGDALQEAGDDLNDETFGSDPVGKDFDFSGNSEAIMRVHPSAPPPSTAAPIPASAIEKSAKSAHNDIWASKDPTAALFKSSGTNRAADVQSHKPTQSVNAPSVFSQLDPLVAPGTDARQSYQAITTPSMPHATPSQPIGGNHSVPRTMADIEAEMQAALRKQQLLAQQQQEFERRQQAEQQQQQILLREQLLQQEERRLFEQEQARLREQQALMQDPLRAIRQAMGEGNGMMPPSHEPRHSIGSGGSPMVQHRQAMSASHPMQPVPTGPMGPAPQELILQELLYQQQQMQQRFIQQRGQQQPFDMDKPDALAATEAQLRMQEAEAKHRRRMAKIQSMARYNDLMTQSDKDFITRVQVAQLVTSDPYAEDFYAQVYASIRQQRNSVDGDGGKVAHGPSTGGGGRPHRRENAMQRMQAQVERLVNNMKNRELNKENAAPTAALQNALGKTSGRSYRAAPRQLLQVAIASPESQKAHPIKEHEPDKAADHAHAHGNELPPPFSQSEGLLIVERLFTNILDIEQLRRNRPSMEDEAALETWNTKLRELLDQIWQALRVSGPLYETNPHPFIALITPLKGKRFIGRLGRDLTDDQKLMTLGVIVNRIEQVDVIRNSSVLDSIDDSRERRNMEKQAFAFQEYVVNQGLQLSPAMRTLKTYTALIEMMMEDGAAFARVVRTRPGLILLEHFFAEASLLKHGLQGPDGEPIPPPPEAVVKWASLYDRLFEYLLPLWTVMFPSSRILPAFPPDSLESIQVSLVTDGFDQHVWRFLAGFALEGTQEQHSRLVTQLRAKVMGTLKMAQRLEEGKAKARKIRNVDLFLNALGLSSSQIPLQ